MPKFDQFVDPTSPERIVTDFEGTPGEVRSAELAELDDGRLLAVLGWVDRSAGDGTLRDAESDAMNPMHLLQEYSADGGRTWGDPVDLVLEDG